MWGNCAASAVRRGEQSRRGSLELLESEKQMCNLISKYSPEYVRSRALESPADAFAVLVSSCCVCQHGVLAGASKGPSQTTPAADICVRMHLAESCSCHAAGVMVTDHSVQLLTPGCSC
jgi:hypothetical protein